MLRLLLWCIGATGLVVAGLGAFFFLSLSSSEAEECDKKNCKTASFLCALCCLGMLAVLLLGT